MNMSSKLNEFLSYTRGQFLGFTVKNTRVDSTTFSGKVMNVTNQYVEVKPYSGLTKGKKKFHKNSIQRLVGFGGLEYNK